MRGIILALCLTLALAATAAAAEPARTKLILTTQDDDLRAGGEVSVVFRMRDGRDRVLPLLRGDHLADHTTREFDVAPPPPARWEDVQDVGLRVRPHGGDGALLRPDEWKVYAVLRGLRSNCVADRLPPGEACFVNRTGRMHFQREQTLFLGLNPVIGLCNGDEDCGGGAPFCSMRVARCEPRGRGADLMGCVRLPEPKPACGTGQVCVESERRCEIAGCTDGGDRDGDGARSVACGGDDCDDNDPRRFPGNPEICDTPGHDEDCDAGTIGDRDADGDGHIDSACWNDGRQF